MEEIVLHNGMKMPKLGLGGDGVYGGEDAYHSDLAKAQYDIYCYAMQTGKCRLFDTSLSYGWNENILGDAIRDAGKRSDILIMSKIGNRAQREHNVRKAFEESLRRLKTDYLDIYLIHWPQTGTFVETYLEMEKLYEEGLVKAIGVCNCQRHHLEELRQMANIVPMVHEYELHPLFTQEAICNYCYAYDIGVVAYSPLGRMHDVLIRARPIRDLAKKYDRSPVQIILRWHYQRGRVAIPQTQNRKHFDEIFAIEEFELTEREVALVSSLNDDVRLRYNPDTFDFGALG